MEDVIIKDEWLNAIEVLPSKIQGEILFVITNYICKGVVMENMKPTVKAVFSLIKNQIDISKSRAENGRRGGQKKQDESKLEANDEANVKQNPSKSQANTQANAKQTPKQMLSKSQANGEANIKQNFLKEKENEEIPPTPPKEDKEKEKKENTPYGVSKKEELSLANTIDYNALFILFNNTFSGKLPVISKLTDARKKAIKARIAEHGKESIKIVFDNILKSKFLTGYNNQNWHANFDWIFAPSNYAKILEGVYANNVKGMDVGVILNDNSTSKYEQDDERWKR